MNPSTRLHQDLSEIILNHETDCYQLYIIKSQHLLSSELLISIIPSLTETAKQVKK